MDNVSGKWALVTGASSGFGVESPSFEGTTVLEADAGMPLGLMESEFPAHELEMTPGSRVVLYSDGVTEAVTSLLEEYGTDRVVNHVVNQTVTVQNLLNDVDKFTSGYPASDDIAVEMIVTTANELGQISYFARIQVIDGKSDADPPSLVTISAVSSIVSARS